MLNVVMACAPSLLLLTDREKWGKKPGHGERIENLFVLDGQSVSKTRECVT
jgi:hypothetical protein